MAIKEAPPFGFGYLVFNVTTDVVKGREAELLASNRERDIATKEIMRRTGCTVADAQRQLTVALVAE